MYISEINKKSSGYVDAIIVNKRVKNVLIQFGIRPECLTYFYTALSNNARRFHFPALRRDAPPSPPQHEKQQALISNQRITMLARSALWCVI